MVFMPSNTLPPLKIVDLSFLGGEAVWDSVKA